MEVEGMGTHLIGVEDLAVIRNLETAFEEETRTSGAYKAFATRADEEGFEGIASLFRAIARAEQIHASNHARVLRHMGGSTSFEPAPSRVESTLENLRSVMVDQKFEVDYLYPTFLTNAVPLFDSTAIRTFHWALEADKSHVLLCSDATAEVECRRQVELGVCTPRVCCVRVMRVCGAESERGKLSRVQLSLGEV